MIGWFTAQSTHGRGAYTRDNPNRSAKTTYNRLLCLPAVVWIAEVVGVDVSLIRQGMKAAFAEANYRSRCAAFRRVVPWAVVAPLMAKKMHRGSRSSTSSEPADADVMKRRAAERRAARAAERKSREGSA